MNDARQTHSYDPNRLLDTLMQRMELASDKALASRLRVSTDIIKFLRAKTLPVSASLLIWMSEASGMEVAALRQVLGDRRAKCRVTTARLASAMQSAEAPEGNSYTARVEKVSAWAPVPFPASPA